jgi:uncharacterized protein DUF3592
MSLGEVFAVYKKVARILCLIVGLGFIAASLGFSIYTYWFVHSSLRADGTVLDLQPQHDPKGASVTYAPVFRFLSIDGQSFTVTSNVYSNPAGFTRGGRVNVLYRRDNPSGARLANFWQLWIFPFVFGLVGIAAAATGVLLTWLERRKKRRNLAAQMA